MQMVVLLLQTQQSHNPIVFHFQEFLLRMFYVLATTQEAFLSQQLQVELLHTLTLGVMGRPPKILAVLLLGIIQSRLMIPKDALQQEVL